MANAPTGIYRIKLLTIIVPSVRIVICGSQFLSGQKQLLFWRLNIRSVVGKSR